jgi:hypothetical protein
MQKTIIGFCGGKWGESGVGKTTAAGFLVEKGFFLVSFSDPIEKVARAQCGWDGDRGRAGKNLLDKVCRSGRKTSEDYWLNLALKSLPSDRDRIVFDDVYFENEFRFIKSQGGKVIRILRPPTLDADLSFDPDETVFNKGGMDNFKDAILLAVNGLGIS